MNKNKAFSLMEVIVSVFILILVLIPSIKLNIQQIEVDFSNTKERASLIKVEYRGDKKIYKNTLLKFEE